MHLWICLCASQEEEKLHENLGGSLLWGKEHRWEVGGKNTARRKEKVILKSFRLKEKIAQGIFYCCCLVAVYN